MELGDARGFLRKEENGKIRITGWQGRAEVVEVPEEVDGLPVTELSDYAFSGKGGITEVRLPASLTYIGDHVFYDCRQLARVELYDGVRRINDGAFKNCEKLRRVTLRARSGRDTCIRNLLGDCPQEILVDIHYPDGQSRLIFPEYGVEYFENYPARLFYSETYGSGQAYRLCLQGPAIIYREYDALFERSGREDRPEATAAMALWRLRYPRKLSEEREKVCREYLLAHADMAVKWCLEENETEAVSFLDTQNLFARETLAASLELALSAEKPALVAELMEIQGRRFAVRRRRRYEF